MFARFHRTGRQADTHRMYRLDLRLRICRFWWLYRKPVHAKTVLPDAQTLRGGQGTDVSGNGRPKQMSRGCPQLLPPQFVAHVGFMARAGRKENVASQDKMADWHMNCGDIIIQQMAINGSGKRVDWS